MSVSLTRLLTKEVLICTALGLGIGSAGTYALNKSVNRNAGSETIQPNSQIGQLTPRIYPSQDTFSKTP
jgi:hypothetical protein